MTEYRTWCASLARSCIGFCLFVNRIERTPLSTYCFEQEAAPISKLTVNVEDAVAAALDERARRHGRSRADEAGEVLSKVLGSERPDNMAARLRARFEPLGGVDLPLPPRSPVRDPPFMLTTLEPDEDASST